MAVDERVALVTVASRGIGRAIAVALAEDGWSVVVNYHASPEAAAETVAQVHAAGGQGVAIRADIGSAAGREDLVRETLSCYGQIDLLVNNAGMGPRQRVDLLQATEASYDEVMAVNLKGPFFLTQLVAKAMVAAPPEERGAPRRAVIRAIINIGSMMGMVGVEMANYAGTDMTPNPSPIYHYEKGGMLNFTRWAASILGADNVRVNCLSPGGFFNNQPAPPKVGVGGRERHLHRFLQHQHRRAAARRQRRRERGLLPAPGGG